VWFRVAKISEFENSKMICREIAGVRIVLGKNGTKLFAFNSSCPHKGGPLQEGELKGLTIKCPWHGYEFNVISGKPTRIPYSSKYGNWRKTGNLTLYEVKVLSVNILVNIPKNNS
jgi:nitrite reductase/ring-hydroxylating ferredoxin subunit